MYSVNVPPWDNGEKVISYYEDDANDAYTNQPNDLQIYCEDKKTILVIYNDIKLLDKLVHFFPFPYYKIKSLKIGSNGVLEGMTIEHLKCEKVLIVCSDYSDIRKKLISMGMAENKILDYNFHTDAKLGEILTVNFGEKCTYNVLIPNRFTGIIWQLESVTGTLKMLTNDYTVIDMCHFPNDCINPQLIGKYNAWDYLFRQPSFGDLKSIYSNCKVNFICIKRFQDNSDWSLLNDKMTNLISNTADKYNIGKSTLGVLLRGTDYRVTPYHPFPCDKHEAEVIINKYLDSYALRNIFLSTED